MRRTGVIGVLVPLVYDVYFSAILSGAVEAAYELDLRLSVATTQHEHAREAALLDRTRATADGTVAILAEASGWELDRNTEHPIVVVDSLLAPRPGVPTVLAAHRAGAAEALAHLLELGHRRIGAITGPPGWLASEERMAAYRDALAGAGIASDPELILESDFEVAPGEEAAAALLRRADPPTAIFAFNDAIAIGALRAARARGLRVPEELSVVGFDDIKFATIVSPALTTVRQPLVEMGRTAVNLLVRLIEGRRTAPLQIELPTRLVVRDSTATPPRRPPR